MTIGAPGTTPVVNTPGPGVSSSFKPVTGNPGDIVLGGTPTATSGAPVTDGNPATTPDGTTPAGTTPDASSGNGLLSALQGLLNNGGYSPAEQQAITEKAAEALAAQKGSNQAALSDQLARSGNAAGYGGAMSSLDNGAAQTASDQARQNVIDFANEQERQKELGASGLTSLLGINTAAQLGTSGQAAGLASLGGGVDTTTAGGSNFSNQNFQATPDPSATTPKTTTPGLGTPTGTTTPSNPSGTTTKPGTDANGNPPSSPNYDPKTDPGSKSYDPTQDPNSPQFNPYGTGTYSGDPTQDPGYVPPTQSPTDPFPVTDPGVAPTDPGTTGDGSSSYSPGALASSSSAYPATTDGTNSNDYVTLLQKLLSMGGRAAMPGASTS
jgi:hypothetical protein